MKTLTQIKILYESKCLDGRDLHRLMQFIPEHDLKEFGIELKDEYVGTHVAIPMTREAVLEQLRKDVEFGFEKALNKRGISSSMMFQVVSMWNWVLEEGLEDYDVDMGYAQYGLPLFKATALNSNSFPSLSPIGLSNPYFSAEADR